MAAEVFLAPVPLQRGWKQLAGVGDIVPSNFFSPRISNVQRLPNGNTLINEGYFGRFFEVTANA